MGEECQYFHRRQQCYVKREGDSGVALDFRLTKAEVVGA